VASEGGFINGPVPVDVAAAKNASQSGKTYGQKMVAALSNQTIVVVTKMKVKGLVKTGQQALSF
jgi:hypothetical protein